MAPPHWIHCNLCYHVMVRQERKFFHLSCRHILCMPCMGKTERGTTCPICKQPLGRFAELNNQMERKEKMYYEPGVLKAYANVCQTLVFQHNQRENLIRGILRCKKALPQLKEMQNLLRQRIVATQRQYEKVRAYRRNLQEIMRQNSPAYARSLAIRRPLPTTPTFTVTSSTATSSSIHTGQGGGGGFEGLVGTGKNNPNQMKANDSGYSDTRTPSSSVFSRSIVHSLGGPVPMTPAVARRPQHPDCFNQLPSTISRR